MKLSINSTTLSSFNAVTYPHDWAVLSWMQFRTAVACCLWLASIASMLRGEAPSCLCVGPRMVLAAAPRVNL
ncbi:hypothetical protein V5799_029341 [Amblyomma americanum]|uniref:Uncharacterized protein n=1 Tax=Amblyomma americanum TaxID=6943 RepID=A0AAQ4ES29_AMBAM